MTNKRAIWQNGNFARLWCGTVLSALGDAAFFILLSWYVIDITGSEGSLGVALLCMSLPRLLFMLAGGVMADRNTSFLLEHHLATPELALLVGGSSMSVLGFSLVAIRDFRKMEEHPAWRREQAA